MAQQPLPKWEGLFSLHLLCDRRSERAFAATHLLRWLVPEAKKRQRASGGPTPGPVTQEFGEPVGEATTLAGAALGGHHFRRAVGLSPDHDPRQLRMTYTPEGTAVLVPEVGVYELVVLSES